MIGTATARPGTVAAGRSPAAWFAAAGDRDAWCLWGKAMPPEGSAEPAHPVICHMLDVAWVARAIVEEVLPAATGRLLLGPLGGQRESALRWLTFIVAMHDLAKVSPAFQAKVPAFAVILRGRGFDFEQPSDARDHGTLGVLLVREALKDSVHLPDRMALRLARSVAAHHGSFASDAVGLRAAGKRERGNARWTAARLAVVETLAEATGVIGLEAPAEAIADDHAFHILLAGLTSVADWIGSMTEVFSYVAPPTSWQEYTRGLGDLAQTALQRVGMRLAPTAVRQSFQELFKQAPWPLHAAAESVARDLDGPALVVIEAPMGEGKTEAALLISEHLAAAAGHGGLYIGLPTQATANQMFGRVNRFLASAHPDEISNLQLAHGEATLHDGFNALLRGVHAGPDATVGAVRAERWFLGRKRTLLATHAVGTIDQALLAVLRAPHGFVRLFGLAGKVVVLDEVHAYDAYTSTLLERMVMWLRAAGASVILLSATLPSSRRAGILQAAGAPAMETVPVRYPRITVVRGGLVTQRGFETRGHPLNVAVEAVDDDLPALATRIAETVTKGGCVGWICNTVARAQAAYQALLDLRARGELPADTVLMLLHGRLLAGDRARREKVLEARLGRGGDRPQRAVVVGTQVLEQSLDVDFDRMVSDVAPIDLVLQRMGRLHRHVRDHRPAGVAAPRMWLVRPAGPALSADLRAVARVYDEYVMRRTLLALDDLPTIDLPAQIERLVEMVYTDPPPAIHTAALTELQTTMAEEHRADALNARQRLMPPPDVTDDPFADFGMEFDDDEDPRVHDSLRALTRLGPPSIDVVCLHQVGPVVALDPEGREVIDLGAPPGAAMVNQLVAHTVGVSRRGLAQRLIATDPPPTWMKSSLLRHRRAMVFTHGRATVSGFALRLDPTLGLVYETAAPARGEPG